MTEAKPILTILNLQNTTTIPKDSFYFFVFYIKL